jgi:YVTN family beta-propeller protein
MVRCLKGAFAALTASAAALAHLPAEAADYAVVARWDLGPAGKWDYATFDPVRHRILIALGDRVLVVSAADGQEVGEVAETNGVHGIALAQDLKLGFATDGKTNAVTVFDLDTLQHRRDVVVSGGSPDAVVYAAPVGKVYVFNGHSNSVSVVDVGSSKEVATITTAGKPEFAVYDGAGRVFFNVEKDAGQIQVIDTATDRIVATWDLSGCSNPTGLAIDTRSERLFSVCRNQTMAVTDAASGKHIASVPIGDGPDAAWVDSATGTIFSANGKSGTLTIVHEDDPDHFRVTATLATARSARTMAFDAVARRAYLPAVISGHMYLIVAAPN